MLKTPLEVKAFGRWLVRNREHDRLTLALLDYDMTFMKIVKEGRPRVVTSLVILAP